MSMFFHHWFEDDDDFDDNIHHFSDDFEYPSNSCSNASSESNRITFFTSSRCNHEIIEQAAKAINVYAKSIDYKEPIIFDITKDNGNYILTIYTNKSYIFAGIAKSGISSFQEMLKLDYAIDMKVKFMQLHDGGIINV